MSRRWVPRPVEAVLSTAAGACLLLAAGCGSRRTAGTELRVQEFAQSTATGDSVGTCFRGYRPAPDVAPHDSVSIAWTCRLDLPGTVYRCSVGGNLEFYLSGPTGVVATGHARTGGMQYGREYTISGTVAVPAAQADLRLEPSWRLTCGGEPMSFVTCGPIRRIEK